MFPNKIASANHWLQCLLPFRLLDLPVNTVSGPVPFGGRRCVAAIDASILWLITWKQWVTRVEAVEAATSSFHWLGLWCFDGTSMVNTGRFRKIGLPVDVHIQLLELRKLSQTTKKALWTIYCCEVTFGVWLIFLICPDWKNMFSNLNCHVEFWMVPSLLSRSYTVYIYIKKLIYITYIDYIIESHILCLNKIHQPVMAGDTGVKYHVC